MHIQSMYVYVYVRVRMYIDTHMYIIFMFHTFLFMRINTFHSSTQLHACSSHSNGCVLYQIWVNIRLCTYA